MSHISENRTVISTVHEGLLQDALELIASNESGITVTKHIKDYYDHDVAVDLAIFTPQLPRGIGLEWKKNGGLKFKGDAFGHQAEYSRIQQLLLLTYQALGVKKSLAMMGYGVEASQPHTNLIRLEAVKA